jgi:MFS family permease
MGADTTSARRWTLLAVCLTTFMLLLDITVVVVALPDMQERFDASFTSLQWVVDAYALTLAALILTAGALADRYGRRLVFVAGVVLFTASSLLCGLAWSITALDVARGLQGIGGAALFATALALGARTASVRSPCGARPSAPPSPAGHSSAVSSPTASDGAGSSSSTSPSASSRSSSR